MKITLLLFILLTLLPGCQRDEITIGSKANDLFFLQNQGASMPVLVEGNTASKVLLLVVHGGPGSDAMKTMNGPFMDALEARYGMVYWDQRNAGSTQGGANKDVLKVATYADDLKKLVLVLKQRYGTDGRIFLYSHSWGGCLSAAFLTTGDNQNLVRGWINLDGATNFPLKNVESRAMQLRIGGAEVAAGRNAAAWKPLLDYAQANDSNKSPAESEQLNTNAYKAIKLIDQVNKPRRAVTNDLRYQPVSFVSSLVNLNSVYVNSTMEAELFQISFSPQLPKLTLPVLALFGTYDFVVPPAVGQEVIDKVRSRDKKMVLFERSGHDPYFTEPDAVNAEVISFVERTR